MELVRANTGRWTSRSVVPAFSFQKPPFAEDGDPGSDLGAFFQECQSAPMLQSYSYEPTLEEQVNEINATLAALEASLPELDEFVESICRSDSLK